jgi:hypothetical protein
MTAPPSARQKKKGQIRRNSYSRRMPRSLMSNHGVKHD